ncbi:MAG: hypothetical protein CMI01_03790 [Oceanospirillaceae bacterium]|nr:hypothetical protein [Oceanospirillaceae bacterium]
MADEAVVVMKFRPVKPGNSVEGKTGMTAGGGPVGRAGPKALDRMRRAEVINENNTQRKDGGRCVHKLPDGVGT